MRTLSLLLAFTAGAIAQTLPNLQRAVVHVEVDDHARRRAAKLVRERAPAETLRRLRIMQPYRLVLSGVAISSEGEIVVPALHPRADLRVEVVFHDGTKSLATMIGTDPQTNLALIKVPIALKYFLPLAEGDSAVKTAVTLLGHVNRSGRHEALSMASEIARDHMPANVHDFYSGRIYVSSLAIAVTINQRSLRAGAACVNPKGELAGLIVSRLPPRQRAVGGQVYLFRGQCIQPVSRIRRVVSDLRKHGRVRRAYWGVKAAQVPADLRAHFDVPESSVYVRELKRNGPAERAGLRRNDILLSLNGKTHRSACAFGEALSDQRPHTPVKLDILRGGKRFTLTATPELKTDR